MTHRIHGATFAATDAVGNCRVQVPRGAISFQVHTYPQPAASVPSVFHHLLVYGIIDYKSSPPVGGAGTEHWQVAYDYLEHPDMYGKWVPIPDDIRALVILNGGNVQCAGVCLRGRVLFQIEE